MKPAFLAVVLAVASAWNVAGAPCENARNVLRVGIPRAWNPGKLVTTGQQSDSSIDVIDQIFREIYAGAVAQCPPPQPPLDIQFTAGNEYQMLEWLEQGQIDATILPDLAIGLVAVDGIELFEIDALSLDRYEAQPAARRKTANGWSSALNADREMQAFLDETWNETSATRRLVLASHLSSTGYVAPVLRAYKYVDAKKPDAAREERFWSTFFERAQFMIDCTSTENCFDALGRQKFAGVSANTTAILFPGERALGADNAPTVKEGGYRERLVIAGNAARRIFDGKTRYESNYDSPFIAAVAPESLNAIVRNKAKSFRTLVNPDEVLGFRTYGFTVDELFQLLRQEQKIRGADTLALVLPGGGVKAAYQSRIIDELYTAKYLRNEAAPEARDATPLKVRSVIGTSGGALLGYFVSQLRADKVDLSTMMWGEGDDLLDKSDIFGWADLMRYLSVVFALGIFCLVLAIASGMITAAGWRKSPLYLRPAGRISPGRRVLMLSLLALLLGAPIVVRVVGGDELQEHVPELEGIFYAMLAFGVMFADHLLVRDAKIKRREPKASATTTATLKMKASGDDRRLIALGGGLTAITAIWSAGGWLEGVMRARSIGVDTLSPVRTDILQQHVTFGQAFGILFVVVIGGGLLLIDRLGWLKDTAQRFAEVLIALVTTLVICAMLHHAPLERLFVAGLLGFVIIGIALYVKQQERKVKLVPATGTLAVTFLLAMFCFPDRETYARSDRLFDWSFITADAVDISIGTFLTFIGMLMLLAGVTLRTYARDRHYTTECLPKLLSGLMFVLLTVSSAMVIVEILGMLGIVIAFELSASFWIALTIVSLAVSVVLLTVGASRRAKWQWMKDGLRFLVSSHPNAAYIRPRWARLLLVSAVALVWWNTVLAPALYGNASARDYLHGVLKKFHANGVGFEPTARFVAPTSVLDRNKARYFMFLPRGADCPQIPQRLIETEEWNIYRPDERSSCNTKTALDADLVQRVIFASGSPFPVFPAHRVKGEWLIDGGYSSNVPVDAARTVSAQQLLIVHSAHPVEEYELASWRQYPGRLIANLARLPGFLFARSQEVDRLSRRGVFVASLAPPREEPNWPSLTDFQSRVVRRMLDKGHEHLGKRIGLVESWGEPSFHVTKVAALVPAK